jgi:hypothetical protein
MRRLREVFSMLSQRKLLLCCAIAAAEVLLDYLHRKEVSYFITLYKFVAQPELDIFLQVQNGGNYHISLRRTPHRIGDYFNYLIVLYEDRQLRDCRCHRVCTN